MNKNEANCSKNIRKVLLGYIPYVLVLVVSVNLAIVTMPFKTKEQDLPFQYLVKENGKNASAKNTDAATQTQKPQESCKVSSNLVLESKLTESDLFQVKDLNFQSGLSSNETSSETSNLSTKDDENSSTTKVVSKKDTAKKSEVSKKETHPSYSDAEVTLMAKAIYREMGGYYTNPSWYSGMTKVKGLRAAVLTGVVMRNRRDTVDGYHSITEVLAAKGQYGKGGQDSLNQINAVKLSADDTKTFKKIAKAILDYDEVELAKELVGEESDFDESLFKTPKNLYYESGYSTLGTKRYAIIGKMYFALR